MSLVKIEDFNSNYVNEIFRGNTVNDFDIYESVNQERIAILDTILVDNFGSLRYLVIYPIFWGINKKILLSVDRCRIDYSAQRIYLLDLTKEQVEKLPEYKENTLVEYNQEQGIGSNNRALAETSSAYQYKIREADQGVVKLYEERLMANKNRQKVGEVAIGKTVRIETARASVPIEKERIFIRRNPISLAEQSVTSDEANFNEGEMVRMEIYEETALIQKEAFLREEVTVQKIVERDLVTAEETLRREELIIEGEGERIFEENPEFSNP